MHVTVFLMRRIPGHLFKGKYRLVKEITPLAKDYLRNEFIVEEKNMFYLRHPFLKHEEASGHAKALKKHEKWLSNCNEKIMEKFSNKKQKTLESHLEHLKVKEDWDVIK